MAIDPTDTNTYPVPSSNAFVFERNAETFDNITNGTADSYENRAGNQIKSLYSLNQVFNEAEASATAAAASESAAATSETNAATSETNAAASASAASTSETNAAASESAAATSEANAATSETNAATSETNAAASEAAAEAAASIAVNAGVSAYVISQLANGVDDDVVVIASGVDVTAHDYFIYQPEMSDPDGRLFENPNGAVGTFAGDFDPTTGVDSGLSAALVQKTIGTAAALDVTTSLNDTAGNKVLLRGSFGVGALPSEFTGSALEISDLSLVLPTGFFSVNSSALQPPSGWEVGLKGGVITIPEGGASDRQTLLATQGSNRNRAWFRFEDNISTYTWVEIFQSSRTAIASEIHGGTIDDKPITPLGLRSANVISDTVKAGLYSLSTITPIVNVAEINDTDFLQYISVQFGTGGGASDALQISEDGVTWLNWGAQSGAAGLTDYAIIPPTFYWRVTVTPTSVGVLSA